MKRYNDKPVFKDLRVLLLSIVWHISPNAIWKHEIIMKNSKNINVFINVGEFDCWFDVFKGSFININQGMYQYQKNPFACELFSDGGLHPWRSLRAMQTWAVIIGIVEHA